MAKQFAGTTENAKAPFLGAEFWKKGTKIEGKVIGTYQTANGIAYTLHLKQPATVNGEKEEKVSVGCLKGFLMALRDAGVPDETLIPGDIIILEATGVTKQDDPTKSPMVNFKVAVSRP